MCKAIAKSMLVFFNGLMVLVGLGVIGVASYLIHEQNTHNIFGTDEKLDWAMYVPLGVGLLIVIMATVNCCVSVRENRCGLGFFGFLQLLFFLILAAAGAFMLAYDKYAHDVAYVPVNRLSAGLGDSQHMLYDFSLGVYDRCCDPLDPAPSKCPAPGNTIFDYCLFFEPSEPYEYGQRASDELCAALNDEERLNWCNGRAGAATFSPSASPSPSPTTAAPTGSPSTLAPSQAPTTFDENATAAPTATTAAPTVTPPTASESTGTPAPSAPPTVNSNGDELHAFQVALYEYSHDFLFFAGIVFMASSGIVLLSSIISCCLACSKSKKDKYEQVGEKEHAKRARQDQEDDAKKQILEGEGTTNDTMTMA